ncbi:mitochondrial carrier [Suhomyces tanzawaensis NRRL Y-17324]|uniref:Mitochondrial thiamine pyrophosphate carrier 1 n=1 Tax=Suhomyces tanzawaensis NRRL Y-17324 TaxID=984487 RepID=A0A1E4SR64_9ASCO|nr:mitochondrial carrier [Suhomyces tanzawaensis NRRL Y-17324]ODV81988.1 mitochondrial carrier [Suhomyces tanzawaensis NRRL Y-17324]
MSSKDHLRKGADVSPYEALMAGSLSGAIARAVTAPLDTLKIRLQLQERTFASRPKVHTVLKNLIRNEGVVALWKGNVPAEIMYILYGGIQFTSYSVLSRALSQVENQYSYNLSASSHSLVVGIGTGIMSTLGTYPFDLLRTRLVANSNKELLSMTTTIAGIYRKDGLVGFFAGIRPAMLSVAATSGLMFWAYELARDFSKEFNNIPFIEGICGFAAGATSKGLTFPLDTIRKRTQMYSITKKTAPISAFKLTGQIIVNEGLYGLYKGFGVSILKTAPTSAVSLFTYEYALRYIKSESQEQLN